MNLYRNLSQSLLTVALFCSALALQAQTDKNIPSVDVQATAQREVMPDELTLSITIRESDYKGKTSLQEKQQEMIRVLKANKVNYEDDLTIREMGSTATFKFFSKNPTPRSEATYFLKLHDAATMQKVVQDLEEQKITNIDLVQTRYTKSDELKIELGREAARKAKHEATALAEAVGQTIGKAISINSWMNNNAPRPRVYRMALAESANDAADMKMAEPTPNITGIIYTVNVSAKFELK